MVVRIIRVNFLSEQILVYLSHARTRSSRSFYLRDGARVFGGNATTRRKSRFYKEKCGERKVFERAKSVLERTGERINADIFGYILCVNVFGTCLCFSWPFCDIAACFRARRLLFVDGRVDGPTRTRTPKERQKFLFFSHYSYFAKIIDLLYLRTDPFSLFTRNAARTRYRFAQSTGGSRSFQAQTQTLSTRSE